MQVSDRNLLATRISPGSLTGEGKDMVPERVLNGIPEVIKSVQPCTMLAA